MRAWALGALVFATLIALAAWHTLHWGADLEPADFPYPAAASGAPCAPGASTPRDADLPLLLVRAPRNYRADHAHGLLIVFSPAGFGPALTERYTGLTGAATARGLIVAYVASRPLTRELPGRLMSLPGVIARRWCIDAAHIGLAGHSDGGTLAQVVALQAAADRLAPRSLIASAAGLREADFAALACPVHARVLLLHGRKDDHFPGYGESAARGWAHCLGCDPSPASPASDGCVDWRGCRGSLRLCLHDGGHLRWPDDAVRRIVELAAAPAD